MTDNLSNSRFTGSLQGNERSSGGVRVFLIGFMGSGKTHWGKIWAQQKGLDLYDLDEIIEAKEGRSIAAIFEEVYLEPTFNAFLKVLISINLL